MCKLRAARFVWRRAHSAACHNAKQFLYQILYTTWSAALRPKKVRPGRTRDVATVRINGARLGVFRYTGAE